MQQQRYVWIDIHKCRSEFEAENHDAAIEYLRTHLGKDISIDGHLEKYSEIYDKWVYVNIRGHYLPGMEISDHLDDLWNRYAWP